MRTEKKQVKDWREMVEVLDELGVSRSPAHTGWGIEIYENNETQTQVVFNCRDNESYLLIHRGF